MSLIHRLETAQAAKGWLDEADLRAVADVAGQPLYAVQAVVSFYPHFRTSPPASPQIHVCRDMACHLQGAETLCARLREVAGPQAAVTEVSCLGRCDTPPALAIDGVPTSGHDVVAACRAAMGQDVAAPAAPAPVSWTLDPYTDPINRYGVLRRLVAGDSVDIIPTLKDSGLRGMGGAAFPTGTKWQIVSEQPATPRYAICNADESEPGTFKDRVILASLPHLVVEGLLIAAHTIGAEKAIIFIRHEYGPEQGRLEAEIERAAAAGLLAGGPALEVVTSPGGYILGEETALLECLEGKRGEPRNKPPFPGSSGLHGCPTLINNVETFACAVAILNRGAAWWKAAGVRGCHGTKCVSISGHVARPGVYEIPMGTTVAEAIDLAGGMRGGRALKGFAPGGASSNFLPAAKADTPIDFDHLTRAGSMLGSGALFVVEEGTDMVALAQNIVRFFRDESCGKCVPCRLGGAKGHALLERMRRDGGSGADLELLEQLADTMVQTSICGLGQVALNPILSVLEHFPDEARATLRA